ncbi:MAG: DNA-deoxyinosine glycosylase [Pseudomonadota bacterium]
MTADLARSFEPIARPDARVLVLGSMPGQDSLKAQQYYAHPRNAFWPIMGTLLGFDAGLPYEQRCAALTANGIALWDVLRECERPGSLDAAIVDATATVNDFPGLFDSCPVIDAVCFNGAKSEQMFRRHALPRLAGRRLQLTRLPSTSPAHASLNFEAKLDAWRAVLETVHDRSAV